MKFFSWLFKSKPWAETNPCIHKNRRIRKFRLNDGTPMIYDMCYDCGRVDCGHVYADESWPDNAVTDTRHK